MHISRLAVRNFRGLENVSFEPGPGLNVIAGPNAVGKSTLLEAIRLAKALLAQRFQGEGQTVLTTLVGNQSPFQGANAQLLALAGDPNLPISIEMYVDLDSEEIEQIKQGSSALALMGLQTELARSITENSLELTQYLSTVDGQNRLKQHQEGMEKLIMGISPNLSLNISVSIDGKTSNVTGSDANAQAFLTYLERSLQPNLTHFNYFTADRSLPQGEVAIQLGAGDVQAQINSYIAQPATKYHRVKQLIVQTLLLNENGRQTLADEFNLIFDNLLPGKKLAGVSFNEHSILKVLVEDQKTGKTFDIDGMSSGEKGLVLTFLTLRLSSKKNTVVLLDEPELHLNAAVCSRIVSFINKYCVEQNGLQLIVCSHAPEVVRDAFEDSSCKLYHLRSSTDLSPVLQQDSGEVFEILNRLGSNTADVLFSRGSVYVEGEHDAAILQVGYAPLLQGYKVQNLGGRSEVEKEIPRLQGLDREGKLDKKQLFIFDRDRSVSSLQNSPLVHVHQLERYCIENYLLDETILFDAISAHSQKFTESRGTFPSILEEIALSQLDKYVISKTYLGLEPENGGLRSKEISQLDFNQAAQILWSRLEGIKEQVGVLEKDSWITDFIQTCNSEKTSIEGAWRSDWKNLASGKDVFDELYVRYEIKMKKVEFKKLIMSTMRDKKTDTWRVLDSILEKELK